MPVRSRISISGFAQAEAIQDLPFLEQDFLERPWLQLDTLSWDHQRGRAVVVLRVDGDNPDIQGGVGGAIYDNVVAAVFATMPSNECEWRFEVDESIVIGTA